MDHSKGCQALSMEIVPFSYLLSYNVQTTGKIQFSDWPTQDSVVAPGALVPA
jgi:hypothetical protein